MSAVPTCWSAPYWPRAPWKQGLRQLFRSLQRFRSLSDYLQIWPGHGAGSACGKALGAVPQSTLGYEKRFNWAFGIDDEATFVRAVLAGQPDPPRYFAQMKQINRAGPRLLGGIRRPARLPMASLAEALELGAPVVDTRQAADFAYGAVPGTINIAANRSFTSWAGWMLPVRPRLLPHCGRSQIADGGRRGARPGRDRARPDRGLLR